MDEVIKTVLVDDNATFLQGLKILMLKYPQFEVVATFLSGIELLDYPGIKEVNLILMDIEMPELDGFETAVRLDIHHGHIKKIAISMYNETAYLEKLACAGFKGYVSKARVAEDLHEVMSRVMNNEPGFHPCNVENRITNSYSRK